MNEIDAQLRESAVRTALAEDCAGDDVTTLWAVPADARAHARILARQGGVAVGLPILCEVHRQLGHDVEVRVNVKDGERVPAGQTLAELTAPSRAVITGERTALNFLQRMSGIATHTAAFVDAVAGLPVRILDTRKTAPGLRAPDKYAVATAGAGNHRLDLAAMVLLKENHIAAAGGIGAAVAAVRAHNAAGIAPSRSKSSRWPRQPRCCAPGSSGSCWITCPCRTYARSSRCARHMAPVWKPPETSAGTASQ